MASGEGWHEPEAAPHLKVRFGRLERPACRAGPQHGPRPGPARAGYGATWTVAGAGQRAPSARLYEASWRTAAPIASTVLPQAPEPQTPPRRAAFKRLISS